jgi:signal recognition particle receptor subunit beta
MMQLTWRQGLPGVVAANKQDLPGALPPEEIAKMLDVPKGVRIVPCTGQDRESGRRVLKELVDLIMAAGVTA